MELYDLMVLAGPVPRPRRRNGSGDGTPPRSGGAS